MPLSRWSELWDEFYSLKEQTNKINEQLVEEKIRLRTMGHATPQPPAPRLTDKKVVKA